MMPKIFSISLTTCIIAQVMAGVHGATPRTWQSKDKKFRATASIVTLNDETVSLRNSDGETRSIARVKLSDEDQSFLDLMDDTEFSVDSVCRISAPLRGYKWKLEKEFGSTGEKAYVLTCSHPDLLGGLTLKITPAEDSQGDSVRTEYIDNQIQAIKRLANSTNREVVEVKRPDKTTAQAAGTRYGVTMRTPKGTKLVVENVTIFSKRWTFNLQAVSTTPEKVDGLLQASQTLIEE